MIGLLRKAGQKVRQFDDAYASKLSDYINSFDTKQGSVGDNLQNAALFAGGMPATRKVDIGDIDDSHPAIRALGGVMEYGVPALNAGTRYGLPALGAVGIANAIDSGYQALEGIPIVPGSQQTYDTLPM